MAQKNWLDEQSTVVPAAGGSDTSWLDGSSKVVSDATEEPSLLRSVGDSAIAFGSGVTQGIGMLANVAGADNPVSRGLDSATKALTDLESPYRKAERQARAQKIADAEKSGSLLNEVGAYAGSFAEAPIDTTLNALGTSLPTLAAGFLPGGQAALAARAAQLGLGAAQGVGAVKGQIYDEVEKAWKDKGASPENAAARAAQVQSYTGDNAGMILAGGALGAAAGSTGAEGAVRRLVGREVAKDAAESSILKSAGMGALKESPMEMLQGGQERLASNIALQNEGFDQPTWQGVAGQAALEGLASAPMGAGFGALEVTARAPAQTAPDTPPTQPTVQPPVAGPTLALAGPDRGVIQVAGDGTARTPAYQAPGYVGDVTDVEPRAVNPVREQVAAAAEQGGVLSSAALTAIDTGLSDAMQPAPEQVPPQISLEEADARDRAAYEQFFAGFDTDPVVSRYFENDDDIPDFDAASNASEEDFLRALGATDEDIQDAIATSSQSAIPQSSVASNAGPQAYEPAGPREGAGEGAASQTGQVNAGAIQQAAPDAPVPGVGGTVGTDGAGSAAAAVSGASGPGGAGTGATTGSGAGATEVGSARTGGRGDSNQALSTPTNLRDALVRVRQQKQEAANAQAAQAPAPAAAPVPGPAAAPAVEAAGPALNIKAITAKQIPDMTDAELQAAIEHYGPAHKRTAKLQKEAQRRAAPSAITPTTTQGNADGPQASQAQQASPQPTQAAAAPAAAAGLTDGAPAENTGAQAAPAPGPQAATAAEPEFTTIKTVYGDSVTVRTADLNSDKPRLRQYTKDGKSKAVPAIHRDNLDLTGDKRASIAKEDADNPFFNVITTKDGSTFASQAAASRELNHRAMGETHEVVAASEVQDGAQGFVIRRKRADAIGTSVNTAQGAINTEAPQATAPVGDEQQFAPETGTLGIPRAEMPQIPSQSHGGLVKHLNAQGIAHETTMVEAAELKPTQAEYSPAKVEAAKTAAGDRAVIVSSDGHIIDGHHQALAAAEEGKPVKAIVLDAPVEQALEAVKASPSAQPATLADAAPAQSPQDFVPAPDGGLDYGEITPEMGRAMRRQAGKIRLRRGDETQGLVHIAERHLDQFKKRGFESVPDFVASVAKSFTAIYKRDGAALDVVLEDGSRGRLVVQLEMAADGDFYDVKTASPIREDQFKNREPLWERAGTSTPTAGESSPPFPWGQNGDDSVPPNAPAAQPEAPKLTPAEAKSLMAWEDLGQKGGVKTHALTFYESQADKDAKRGRMIVAKVSKEVDSGNWTVEGTGEKLAVLGMAKKKAEQVGMEKAVADGFVEAAAAAPADATPEPAKPIEDAGEKIGGARKDRWKERGLNLDDLDAMTEAEGAELATKANVWKPDYEALAAQSEPVSAAMTKVIYDRLAAKPKKNTPEGRRQYVQMMRIVRDVLTEAKGPDAVRNAYLEIRKRAGLNAADPAAKSAGREMLFSVYKGRSDPFVLDGGDLMKVKKMVTDGFPAKGDPWKTRLTVGRAEGGAGTTERGIEIYMERSAEVGTPLTREQILDGFYRVSTKDNKTVAFAASKADAEAAAATVYERDMKGKKDGKPEPVRPNLDELKRENLPQRIDRDVTSEDFVRDLGFRGVEFGNWSAQDERQRILNMAYDGLMDLAEIMGVPPKAMSLNGTLGMAFGARGGGRFAAHYEPGKLVINMTKIRGGGSMAHEWAHAMDHYFGELDKPDAYTTQARGASGWYSEDQYNGVPRRRMERVGNEWKNVEKMRLDNLRPEMAAAFDEVMRALFQKQITKAEMVRSQELDLERTEALARSEQDAEMKAMYQNMVQNKREALNELRNDPEGKLYAGRGRSDYAQQAQALSGKSVDGYWVRPTEMFARAFESWVFDRVTAMGARSDYLVHGVEEDRFAGGAYKGNPYPTGEERARINAAFDKLAGTIKTKETDKGVAMFSRVPSGLTAEEAVAMFNAANQVSPDARNAQRRISDARLVATQQLIDGIKEKWTRAPEIIVARNMQDSQVPQRVRDYDAELKSQGANGEPRGFIYLGKVYLLSDQLSSPAQIAEVLFHEVLGHYGLRGAFGDGLKPILQQIGTMRRRDVVAKAREYGLFDKDALGGMDKAAASDSQIWAAMSAKDRLSAAEEVLAEMAQTQPTIGFVQRAIAAIRNWLRANVPGFNKLALTDADIVQAYILPARGYVTRSQETGAQSLERAMAAFSRDTNAGMATNEVVGKNQGGRSADDISPGASFDAQAAFEKHGGTGDIDESTDITAKSQAFADMAEAEGYTVIGRGDKYVTIKKSFGQDADGYAKTAIIKVRISDHSNVNRGNHFGETDINIAPDDGYSRDTFADALRKIQSAYVNDDLDTVIPSEPTASGLSDAANPDIRFSRAGMADLASKARDELNRTFTAPGKLSWWHKTVGTMYNLAERSPAFKRVFEAAQGFVDDVSYYATDAAEQAPRLLPKLETWRDIAKRPITAADNAAVAKPVFEGTLVWTRDEAGKPVRVDDLVAAAEKLTAEEKARRLLRQDKISAGMLRAWQGLPLEQYEKLVESRYESQMLKAGIVWTPAELKSMFKLTDDQVALYKEFRAATDRSLDTMARSDMLRYGGKDVADLRDMVMDAADAQDAAQILRDHLQMLAKEDPGRAGELSQLSSGMLDRAARVQELQEQGYAPLSRFGKYTVDVVDANGERQYFGLFETQREANIMAMKMRKGFGQDAVSQGTLSNEEFKLLAGITPESLELFGNMLGLDSTGDDAQDQAFQEYLRRIKTNRSAMRRLIHRQGIAGYSEDVGPVLASFIYSNARQTSAGLHMGELGEAVTAIPKQQGELKDAAVQLSEYVKNPQEEAQAIRGLLFAQYLGGSIASAVVNMSQPAAVTFPWLSQFGGAKQAAAELGRAAKNLANKAHRYEADLAAALKQAEEEGTVSPQEVHQLMAQARGSGSLRPGDGTRTGDALASAGNALTRLSLAWGKVFGAAEQVNRRMTYIAAFRIAKAQKMDNPAAFAKKAVIETQFTYSKANKMKWGRGAVGATVMTFKTYSVAYLELLGRMWSQGGPEGKKAVLLALGMLMLMGGAGGLPFAEDAEDLVDGLAQLAGYNFNSKKAKQELLESVFGQAGAGFVERGITGLPGMPLDVSGRLGMGNLLPATGLFKEKTDHTRDVLEVAGPVGDLAKRAASGARSILAGDVGAGLLQIAPAAVRNAAKGADMAATGMYRDDKGYKVLDTSPAEAAMKAIGFQPASVAKVQEANFINQQAKNFYNMKAQEIRAKWARGIFEKDQGIVAEARADLEEWNRKNPEQRIVVSMPAVLKRVREMSKTKDQRIADTAPRAMRQQMREEAEKARATL